MIPDGFKKTSFISEDYICCAKGLRLFIRGDVWELCKSTRDKKQSYRDVYVYKTIIEGSRTEVLDYIYKHY